MPKSNKYTGDLIIFNEQSLQTIKDNGFLKKANNVLDLTKEWAKRLCIDPLTRIEISYLNTDKFLMCVDLIAAQYKAYNVSITTKCLRDARNLYREMDVLHEMIHIQLWQNYIRAVNGLIGDEYSDYMLEHEETLVSTLEIAFYRMKYGKSCMIPPVNFEISNTSEGKMVRIR